MHKFKTRGVWCGSSEAGKSLHEVEAYVDRMYQAGFNTILVHLKGGDGLLHWPSSKFPQAVAPGYEDFDLPAHLVDACKKRGMSLHAWFIDYYEGENGAAYKLHPEWAATDPHGRPSSEATLRGRRYGAVWMCPARRPGYTDQWLIPLHEEFAQRYEFDAIHHDYIRYPGDMAPDTYCFCDDCLENLPKYAHYFADRYPDEPFFHELYDRPFLESHWEPSPKVLPENWKSLDRFSKSRFLLEGSFFVGGRPDLDYFFYEYRIHWVTEFARRAAEVVRRTRPAMELSAAVFKNPIHSGRFIGQDWRRFAPYVETCVPMDYRDHFPGDFETYLNLLGDTIALQKGWAKDFRRLWIGFAVNFLYKEEHQLGIKPGQCDPGKVRAVIDRIRSSEAEGVVVFSEGQVNQYNLWKPLAEAFAPDRE